MTCVSCKHCTVIPYSAEYIATKKRTINLCLQKHLWQLAATQEQSPPSGASHALLTLSRPRRYNQSPLSCPSPPSPLHSPGCNHPLPITPFFIFRQFVNLYSICVLCAFMDFIGMLITAVLWKWYLQNMFIRSKMQSCKLVCDFKKGKISLSGFCWEKNYFYQRRCSNSHNTHHPSNILQCQLISPFQ